tara:strand:+ start:2862 stop:3719 length:858 start_codon:yes stop_codon:yes gene_type:complete
MAYNTGSDPTLAELITAKFIPEMYSQDVLMHTMSNLVTVNAFNHRYQKDLRKGSKVNIPVFTEGSVTEVTPGTEPTAGDLAGTAVSITVDNWFEHTVEISDLMSVEQEADYLAGAAKSSAYSLQKKIDTSVGVLFSTLAASSVQGADGQTFTDDIFRSLVETLDENDVPDEERSLIGDPSMKSDLLQIDKFVRVDYVRTPSVPTGTFGSLYNSNVLITNNLTAATTGNYGVYSHRDAIGIAMQMNPRSQVWNLGYKFITKIITDAAWGADEIRDTFGKSFYTRKS